MAFLEGLNFTGSLGNLSAYRMKGSDKIVLRTKGGASKEKIKNDPAFASTRRNMSEFSGCSTMGKTLRGQLGNQTLLADYNISGPINALLKVVQTQDQVGKHGKRQIALSKYPGLLEGFSLNEKILFDSIIRNTVNWSISRDTRSAHVDIPRLMPGVNFFTQNARPMFSIIVTLGTVPDFSFNEQTGEFEPNEGYHMGWGGAKQVETEWLPTANGMDALTLEIEDPRETPDDGYTLVLGIGIRFGQVYGGGIVQQVARMGAAKILGAR